MYFFDSGVFDIIFGIMFIAIFGIIIVTIINNISTWNKNNNSPRLTVDATVVSKRTEVVQQQHAHGGDMSGAQGYSTTVSTFYYVCFQVESGDRMEFGVKGKEYNMLREGDYGKLNFQGTRYLGFERKSL